MLKPVLFTTLLAAGAAVIGFPAQRNVQETPAPGMIFRYPERIPLQDGGFFNSERGMVFVPINRSDPKSRVIAVEFYRFRAGGERKGPPVFFLHGGPGFRGLPDPLRRTGTFEQRWRPYLEIGDVVVVGQRCIGTSKPDTMIEISFEVPMDRAVTEKERTAAIQKACAREKAFWEAQGLDLKGLNVVEAAADVNDVRKALGYDKIIIWGGSFGSHWGMTIMRRYPEIVARAILSGIEGPNHTYDHPGHLWKVYERVAAEAEKSPRLKDRIPEGGLVEALKTVIRRVEKENVTVTVTDPNTRRRRRVLITGRRIRSLAQGYSGGLRNWPADVIRLHEGDYTLAAETLVRRERRKQFLTASYFMLDHGSGITAEREAGMLADPAVKILGNINWWYMATRDVWKSDLGDEFRKNFECRIPTLIVQGTWDTSTPFENAEELAPFFRNSKFVRVIRGSHGAISDARRVSREFRDGIVKFAKTGDLSGLPDSVEMPVPRWFVPR